MRHPAVGADGGLRARPRAGGSCRWSQHASDGGCTAQRSGGTIQSTNFSRRSTRCVARSRLCRACTRRRRVPVACSRRAQGGQTLGSKRCRVLFGCRCSHSTKQMICVSLRCRYTAGRRGTRCNNVWGRLRAATFTRRRFLASPPSLLLFFVHAFMTDDSRADARVATAVGTAATNDGSRGAAGPLPARRCTVITPCDAMR